MIGLEIEERVGYILLGFAGCIRCKKNTFVEGVYHTEEKAQDRLNFYLKNGVTISKLSKKGYYQIKKVEYEAIIDDGEVDRIILGDHVFSGEYIFETREDIWLDMC